MKTKELTKIELEEVCFKYAIYIFPVIDDNELIQLLREEIQNEGN